MGRLGELTPKACLPVGNRPLLAHHFELLQRMGINEVVVVTGHISRSVEELSSRFIPAGMNLRFVEQSERRGIAHALLGVRTLVADQVVLILGDTWFVSRDPGLGLRTLEAGGPGRVAAVLSVREVEDPDRIRSECTVRFDEDGRLVEIVEKPEEPFNRLKPCGMYFFTRNIFDAIAATPASALRGEVEITDAIQTLVDLGHGVGRAHTVDWDCNLTTPGDLLSSNLEFLARAGAGVLVGDGTRVHGTARLRRAVVGRRVCVPSGTLLERSLVFDDALLEPGRQYRGAIVTPSLEITDCFD